MVSFFVRRLAVAVPLLLGVSFVVFALLHVAPGDPVLLLTGGRPVTPATEAAIRSAFHLDRPFLVQYWLWVTGLLTGNLGQTIVFHSSVASLVAPRVLPTLELAGYSFLLVIAAGVSIGALAAVYRDRWAGRLAAGVMLVTSAVASFVSAVILLAVLAVALGWFPIFGDGGPGLDRLYHLTLPAIALALAIFPLVGRSLQSTLSTVLGEPYIEAARSRGYSPLRVVFRHALRNAMLPVITTMGLCAGYLIVGTVIVEYTFGLSGLGALLVQAVEDKDYPTVQAITLLFAAAFVLINLVVDVLYSLVDPRVRLTATHR